MRQKKGLQDMPFLLLFQSLKKIEWALRALKSIQFCAYFNLQKKLKGFTPKRAVYL
jgi:hypothetical protein